MMANILGIQVDFLEGAIKTRTLTTEAIIQNSKKTFPKLLTHFVRYI